MSYTFTVPYDAQVTWNDADNRSITRQFNAGQQVGIPDACEAYRFATAYMAAADVGYSSRESESELGAIRAACQNRPSPPTVIGQTEDVPVPAADPVPVEPGNDAGSSPPPNNPPVESTAPEALDTPPPPPTLDVTPPPPTPGVPDGRPAEERAHDPEAPSSDAGIAADIQMGGDPNDSVERVRRNEPTRGLPHYDFGRNDEPHPQVVSEPVDLFRGAFIVEETDVQIPGRLRPLELVRRYRSAGPYFGPWGFNWDHNYNAYLRPLDDGWVAVWTGLLNEDVYQPDPALGWTPPLGVTARLEHHPPDALGNERWAVTTVDGTAYRFEQPPGWPRPDRFPLIEIRDRFDNVQTLTYDSEGRVERVADDLGHSLTFGYGDCGLLEELTDGAGRRWRYVHDSDREHLIAVVQPPTEEAPDGAVTQYEYDTAEAHGRLRHNLVRIIGSDGCAKVENAYGKDPASDDFARVVEQRYAAHRAAYRASVLSTPPRLPEAINLRAIQVESIIDGDYRIDTFNFRGGRLEERYRLARDGSYRLAVEAYRYDERGNLALHRRPNGMTTHYIYDVGSADPREWANLLEIRLEAPPSRPATGRRVARMRYEPAFQLLTRFEDESGAETRLHYGHQSVPGGVPALERIEHPTATLPDGATQTAETRCTFSANGQLTREVSPEGREVAYEYGMAGPEQGYLVARVRDPNNIAAADRFTYDLQGNAVSVTDGEGATTTFAFDARNRLVSAVKPGGAALTLRYHLDGELAELRRPRGLATGLPAGETEIVTLYEYDVLGRIKRQIDAANSDVPRERRYEYDAYNQVIAATDALGRRNEVKYDERGGVLTQTRITPDGTQRTLRLIRELNGGVRTSVLPGGQRVDWRHDSWDRVRRQEEPAYADGRVTVELTYGDDDLLIRRRVTGPDGFGAASALLADTTYGFDERGRLVTEDHGIGTQTTAFDADGLPVRHIDPSGAQVDHGYDALGRLVRVTDGLGNITEYGYDRVDRLVEESITEPSPAGAVSRRERRSYDARGDQLDFVDALGRRTVYETDDAGQVVATVDPTGARTEARFNPFAELVLGRAFVGAGTIEHWIERDAAGRATALVDATGATWVTELDGFDVPVRHVTADGRTERLRYDVSGALVGMELPGGSRVDYVRRADGALDAVDFTAAGGSVAMGNIGFVRDGLGRLISAAQGPSTVGRRYDIVGRVTEERIDGVPLLHVWDDAVRTSRITYSDGRIDRREYDELGRLVRVVLEAPGTGTRTSAMAPGSVLCAYTYEGLTRLVSRTLANGHQFLARYDAAQRLIVLEHSDGAGNAMVGLEFVADGAGRRRLVAITGAPWSHHAYDYDALSRLVTAAAGAQHGPLPDPADPAAVDAFLAASPGAPAGDVTDTYTLGAADTRGVWTRTDATGQVTRGYSYDIAHRLTEITTNGAASAVTHDADGRRTADDRWSYRHDVLGRLREVLDAASGALALELEWDALDRLAAVRRPSGEGVVLRHLGERVVERQHTDGSLTQETYGALPREVPLRVDPLSVLFRLQDHRGSTVALADDGGAMVERHLHEDFGAVTGWDGVGAAPVPLLGLASPVLFAGLEYLPDVGLYIAGERAYDPNTGLFLAPDPLGALDSTNLYLYAKHDPVDLTDISGRYIESAWDVFSLGVGIASLTYNLTRDKIDWWAVGLDTVGILADTVRADPPWRARRRGRAYQSVTGRTHGRADRHGDNACWAGGALRAGRYRRGERRAWRHALVRIYARGALRRGGARHRALRARASRQPRPDRRRASCGPRAHVDLLHAGQRCRHHERRGWATHLGPDGRACVGDTGAQCRRGADGSNAPRPAGGGREGDLRVHGRGRSHLPAPRRMGAVHRLEGARGAACYRARRRAPNSLDACHL